MGDSEYLFEKYCGIAVLDNKGRFMSANSFIYNFFDKMKKDVNINNYNLFDIVSENEKLKLKDFFESLDDINKEASFKLTIENRMGMSKVIYLYCLKMHFNDNNFFNCTFFNGITPKIKTSEIEMINDGYTLNLFKNKNKNNLKIFENNIPVGLAQVIISDEFNVVYANKEFYSLFGLAEDSNKLFKDYNLISKEEICLIRTEIKEQLERTNKFMVEFKSRRVDGSYVWIHMRARKIMCETNNVFYGVFLDITSRKNTELALEREKERYRIIVESTGDIIFEYYIKNDLMILNEKVKDNEKSVNYRIEVNNYLKCLNDRFLVHPDDIDVMKNICKGDSGKQCEIRLGKLRGKKGEYYWYSINSSVIFDENGMLIQTIGALRNIDEIKKSEQKLKETAEHDPMTALYNKVVAERLIRNCMLTFSNESICAFLIVDIDDFKNINDTMGHMYGDIVIKEITSRIKSTFRSSDVVGRVGGDEFLIFMSNAGSLDKVKKKAEILIKSCNLIFKGSRKKINVSVSIGIAICNDYENEYEKVYNAADMALYRAKHKGKGCYCIADKEK